MTNVAVDPTTKSIVYEPLTEVLAAFDAQNAKDHDVGLIMASIRRHGFIGSITRDHETGLIAAGHGRCKALHALRREDARAVPAGIELMGGEWWLPVTYERFANNAERAAYALGDNQSTIIGGWHTDMLLAVLEQTVETPQGLDGTGFDGDDIDTFLALLQDTQLVPQSPPGGDLSAPYVAERYGVTVNLESQHDEDQVVELLVGHGYITKRHSR